LFIPFIIVDIEVVYKGKMIYTVDMENTTPEPKKVFVVEDDVFLSSILTQKMTEHHLAVTAFTSAEDALAALKNTLPDILTLDIYLPGLNGLEALKKMRADDHTKDLKVIVVSNTDEKKDRDLAQSLNAKFIIKAVTEPEEIVKEIISELGLTTSL
jgi:CheY-like chemotaxis protein